MKEKTTTGIKLKKEEALRTIDKVLAKVGGNLLSGVAFTFRPKDKESKDSYVKVTKRLAGVRSTDELKKEFEYLTGVFRDASPTVVGFFGELATIRTNISKRLIRDAREK